MCGHTWRGSWCSWDCWCTTWCLYSTSTAAHATTRWWWPLSSSPSCATNCCTPSLSATNCCTPSLSATSLLPQVCMLLSSLYHTLNCRSEESCRRWLSYDIFGISASFLAIFLSGIYYGFWCPEYLGVRNTYMALVGCLFLGAMTFLLNPKLMGSEWDNTRVALFTGWAVSGLLPLAHWMYIHGGFNHGIVQVFLPRIIVMYIISGAAVFVYLGKIPERYFPGRFDIVGSSHQLWHLIVVAALIYWHQTGLLYAKFRLTYGCRADLIDL
ncbi:progestin and adipoQ receptor family member 3-like isoform X3 [Scylla paramamosain]|uniref:progestin and adipoQ receptor family member 3-like isoform X3 n=1 Tax=Scylla paramamosain TaxID=85552 RepID=UPI0030826FC9